MFRFVQVCCRALGNITYTRPIASFYHASTSNLSSNEIKMETQSPFLQILALSVAAADKAGDLVRNIMAGGSLGIVEKTGADDLQVNKSIQC